MSNLKLDLTTGQIVLEDPKIVHMEIRCVEKATDLTVANDIVGKILVPFKCKLISLRAIVDSAGVTGNSVIDVNKNGTTVMTTDKITIETTETDSNDATTQPAITTSALAKGDILTIDVDSLSTTKPKGLVVHLKFEKQGD